ncbi:hypothetical protein [Bacillus sp. FJAT-27245]|uniref:hypothetical protein n=1 Tax=Bacillus sp. FJAT-27245 TaxID=1684144 RepID=UPI0006A76CBA|nr:hypothetical protein [Bacillus sp. FJAT-27245]
MKKLITSILLLLALTALASCSKDGAKEATPKTKDVVTENVKEEPAKSDPVKSEPAKSDPVIKSEGLADLISYFKSSGFTIGEVKEKAFDMLGAKDGFGIELNGHEVEFYEFDSNAPNLKEAESKGTVSMDQISFPVLLNGNIILVHANYHPDKESLINTFNNYK